MRGHVLNRRQLDAIGKRISERGDMAIPISTLMLGRLLVTAEVPFAFGNRVLEVADPCRREVDAIALNALVMIAESKLPREATAARLHVFEPDRRYPWFCGRCGYGPYEPLRHETKASS